MANRSDFNSVLPRSIKRMLSLQSTGDAHVDGELRRLFAGAHEHHKFIKQKRIKQDVVSTEEETIETAIG